VKGEREVPNLGADIRTYASTIQPTAIKFDMITQVRGGSGVFVRVSHVPILPAHQKNLGPSYVRPYPLTL